MPATRHLAAFLALVALSPAAVHAWPQDAGGPDRTGVTSGIPLTPDVAFTRTTDILYPITGNVIAVGRTVYFLANGTEIGPTIQGPDLDEVPTSLLAIGIDTGSLTRAADIPGHLTVLASDGTDLYAVGSRTVVAWSIAESRERWRASIGSTPTYGDHGGARNQFLPVPCAFPVVTDSALYVACVDEHSPRALVDVHAFATADGAPLWADPFRAYLETHDPRQCPPPTHQPLCYAEEWSYPPTSDGQAPFVGLSLVGPHLFFYLASSQPGGLGTQDDSSYVGGYRLYHLDAATGGGEVLDNWWVSGGGGGTGGWAPPLTTAPTGDDRFIFTKGQFLNRYVAGRVAYGAADQTRSIITPDEIDLGAGLALLNDTLYATSSLGIYRLSLDLQTDAGFVSPTLPPTESWAPLPLAADGRVLLAASHQTNGYGIGPVTFRALDAATGNQLWAHALSSPARYTPVDGAIVVVTRDAHVTVIGTTGASIVPAASFTTSYPAAGGEVHVDLSGTKPGALGPATEFQVDWGDGTRVNWQSSPLFQHRYATSVDTVARFQVRNAAGQISTLQVPFFVGRPDPAVNILNSPFADQYQETTFFVLGLVATATVALVGFYRAGRKRRRLEKELRALENDYKDLEHDTTRCEAMLRERKALYRALFLAKRLEDAHTSLLERRVDELRQGLRVTAIDEKLKFLPHGMVQHLRRLLADGRIDAWERGHFIEALEREGGLSRTQRAQARAFIDAWFTSDVGGREP